MRSRRLLIRDGFVVSMNPDAGEISNCDVLVEDGVIGQLVDVDLGGVFRKLDESRNHILSGGGLLPEWATAPMAAV